MGETTTASIDSAFSGNAHTCSDSATRCYRLHSGALLSSNKGMRFGGTDNTRIIVFYVDPDGQASAQKSVGFTLGYNGRLRTYQNSSGLFHRDDVTVNAFFVPGIPDPTWFTWN